MTLGGEDNLGLVRALEPWHFWFVGRDELVVNLLRRHRAPGPIVDVGAGTGRFAASLRARGFAAFGLDRGRAAPEHPGGWLRADVERLPLADGAAGTILARDVLEHVNDQSALAQIQAVLRPGGLLLVLVPGWPSLWSARDEAAGHQRRYTRASLRRALEEAGFEVAEMRGYQFFLLPLAAASRAASRLRPGAPLRHEERVPAALNRPLARINRLEAALARHRWPRPPTGSTLAVVARRRDRP